MCFGFKVRKINPKPQTQPLPRGIHALEVLDDAACLGGSKCVQEVELYGPRLRNPKP